MAGAVLNALNIRLDAPTIAFMLGPWRGEAATDRPEFSATIAAALALMTGPKPVVIDIDDPLCDSAT